MRRFYLLITCMIIGLLAGACASPAQIESLDNTGTASSPEQDNDTAWIEVKLYFRNNNYNVKDAASTPVISVVRSVQRNEFSARVALNALISGPSPRESDQFGAGPVIHGADLDIEDIYIKNNICIVHLVSPHQLPLYDYEDQSDALAESVFVKSLLYTLAGVDQVEAVWLFCNGKPWKSSYLDWSCPLAPPGRGICHTLYFCKSPAPYPVQPGADCLIPVRVRLISPSDTEATGCLFKKIINLLSRDYDPAHRATLPEGVQVLGLTLAGGQLSIDLAGPFPESPWLVQALYGSLVYTFTGFPEIETVMVMREGRPWECGGVTWDQPLGRDDFAGAADQDPLITE